MTTLDADMIPDVIEMIEDIGVSATLSSGTGGNYDPTSGGSDAETLTSTPVTISPPVPYDRKYVNGSTVKQDDLVVYMAGTLDGSGPVPDSGNRIVLNGTTFIVVTVSRYYTGDLVAAYEIQLRR